LSPISLKLVTLIPKEYQLHSPQKARRVPVTNPNTMAGRQINLTVYRICINKKNIRQNVLKNLYLSDSPIILRTVAQSSLKQKAAKRSRKWMWKVWKAKVFFRITEKAA